MTERIKKEHRDDTIFRPRLVVMMTITHLLASQPILRHPYPFTALQFRCAVKTRNDYQNIRGSLKGVFCYFSGVQCMEVRWRMCDIPGELG